jgi:hypothetical protein
MCIIGDGAEAAVEEVSPEAEPEPVFPAPSFVGLLVPSFLSECAGEAAFSSTMVTSVAAEWVTEPVETFGGESFEVDAAPVLARLGCFCCSLSEGDRDRFRLVSASGIEDGNR